MSDIFISYSRKDSEQALALAEKLRADGMTVWIDLHGIPGAEQWATEIATAIRDCTNFILLLSENAIGSQNVLREVVLASEKNKRMVPVSLARTVLPVSFEYHLAGIQRTPYSDYDAVLSAIRGRAIDTRIISEVRDDRKSLMILPFEDISPDQDNGWFADGLMNELISAMMHVKSLRVIDRRTSMEFKGTRSRTRDIARDLDVRFFLEGCVRKFGDHIKISVELLDIVSGEYFWHDAHEGAFSDIFTIQETVTKRVVEGLRLTLSKDEKRKIGARGTENAEAYELYLRGHEAYILWTRQGIYDTIAIAGRAIEIDPHFADAICLKAAGLLQLFRLFDRNPSYLQEAESLFDRAKSLNPDVELRSYLIILNLLQGRLERAESLAIQGTREHPQDCTTFFSLGYFYYNAGHLDKAVAAYEESLRLKPDHRMTYWNLVEALDRAGRKVECRRWAEKALLHFERWAVLHPDDQFARGQYALLLLHAGQPDTALSTIAPLLDSKNVDGLSLYTAATIYMHIDDHVLAHRVLERAIEAGFAHYELLVNDPNFEPYAERPEFQKLLERMRSKMKDQG